MDFVYISKPINLRSLMSPLVGSSSKNYSDEEQSGTSIPFGRIALAKSSLLILALAI